MASDKCKDPNHEWYPYYGVAPHTHDLSGGSFIGSTRVEPKEKWPPNFKEDEEAPGCGVFYCPGCVASDVSQLNNDNSERKNK